MRGKNKNMSLFIMTACLSELLLCVCVYFSLHEHLCASKCVKSEVIQRKMEKLNTCFFSPLHLNSGV